MGSLANPDLRMMQSNLLILLLLNLAFAAALDNVPEEETNRVHRRGPKSGAELIEECAGDIACLLASYGRRARQLELSTRDDSEKLAQLLDELMEEFKMIDWSKTKESGDLSIDRRVHHRGPSSSEASEKRTQFMEECDGDAACVRGKMRDWRKAKKSGEASLDRLEPSTRDNSEELTQLLDELMEEFKMTDWSKTKESGEASLDRRVHHRGPSSSDTSEKRTQFMEECGGGDGACIRGKMREWRKARKAGEASF